MSAITANDLKTRGITAVEAAMEEGGVVRVSVRGQERYVVMSLERYAALRELELLEAIRETRADYAAGHFEVMSAEEHLRRLLDDDAP